MADVFGDSTIKEKSLKETIDEAGDGTEKTETDKGDKKEVFKRPVWMKQHKKPQGKKAKKPPAKLQNKPSSTPPPVQNDKTEKNDKSDKTDKTEKNDKIEKSENKKLKESKRKDEDDDSDVASSDESVSESGSGTEDEDRDKSTAGDDDDDDQWDKFQKRLQKRERLEARSKTSHPVHCPYYPLEKQEYWWCYICDRKSHTLLTAPAHVTGLVDSQEIQLRFTAPRWPGLYTLTACLRSDSYMGMDQQQELKLDVKEAAPVPNEHPQWELSDSETDQKDQEDNESEFTTDDEEEDE